MKWGKDFWVVASITLLLVCILQQALMGNAMNMLIDRITEIEEVAGQQGGWVYFPAMDGDLK